MGSSSSKPKISKPMPGSLRPDVPAQEINYSEPGALINGWRPWGGGAPKGPTTFAAAHPQVLTQLALYDHMYTYDLLQYAGYMKKILALIKKHEFMRNYFAADGNRCWTRLERGKQWAANSKKQGYKIGLLAFYGDPMYGSRCDWRHVANVLMPLLDLDQKTLPHFRYPSQQSPSAFELSHAKF